MRNKNVKSLGFTLIELMVTISIAGILLAIAVPSFTSVITSNRLTTFANDLVTTFNLARSEAIKRGVQVTVLRKGANSSEWESGWDVFVDINGDKDLDDVSPSTLCETNANGSHKEDCLLRTYPALPSGFTLRTGASSYKDYAAYLPSGLTTTPVGDTFTLCNESGANVPRRTITINSTGRPNTDATPGACP
ncbi:pilus assembly protein FimT [Methylomonas lenta]|uniref:Type II secretion system protein H n=1 Tax=Methylomonas lenta TaxID=980561 RepID=A0A177NSW6_9GAMM|nr:GspH/FimT family pseudopilin [Methylomonas lenta]OAI21157.1 pilus assembly protein FimT [Methylomonas lenta]